MGGKNFLLGYSFVFVGILSIVYAIVFLIVLRRKKADWAWAYNIWK